MVSVYRDTELSLGVLSKASRAFIRSFSVDTDDEHLVWHRDKVDRLICPLRANGWKFQYDNKIPFDMRDYEEFKVEKNSYHRLIRGDGDLKLLIFEYD